MSARITSISILSVALFLASSASADPFTATYTFTGSPGNQVSEPVDAQPVGATLADIARGSSLTPVAGADSINSSGFTTSAAPDLVGGFYEFSITPDAGYVMDLTELAFTERRSGTGIHDIELRSSLDVFAAPIFSTTVPDDLEERRQTIPLGAAFQDLTSAVTFRIYGFSAESTAGTWRLGVSGASAFPANLVLTGDLAAVPEPASLLLVGVGACVLLGRRLLRNTL
jgi:hypothetical protein